MANRTQNRRWFQAGAGVGASLVLGGLGYFFWQIFNYIYHLLRQPFLMPQAIPAAVADNPTLEAKAAVIALANLRASVERRRLPDGQEKLVVCAGHRNFREPWARDFGFASFGLVSAGELQAVRECLEVFLINQKPSGQFPVKIHSTTIPDRYLHSILNREQPINKPIRPKYVTAHQTISLDGNALIIIGLLNYTRQAGALEFAAIHWSALKRAINWMEKHALDADGLLHQSAFADWADSIARAGRVLYTNVLYWKALLDLSDTASELDYQEDAAYFKAKANFIRKSINDHFWRSDLGYFVTNDLFDNLSSSGNLLAIAWGLTTAAQSNSILDRMAEFRMAEPVPTQVVHRSYPIKFIALENRLGGIPNYHTSAAWLWIGGWHVIALARMERVAEAEAVLNRLAQVIVRDGAVHEVYSPEGNYLSTFWYTSEAPLTWSAGMVVYAYHVFQRHKSAGQ